MYELLRGECLELMKDIPEKSIDMILCDLPYGTTNNKWDKVIDFEIMWSVYNRIIKDNGAILLFCDGLFTSKLTLSNEKNWRYNLVWNKGRGSDFLNANVKPLKSHEDIAVFYKKNLYTIKLIGIRNLIKKLLMVLYLIITEIEKLQKAKV